MCSFDYSFICLYQLFQVIQIVSILEGLGKVQGEPCISQEKHGHITEMTIV